MMGGMNKDSGHLSYNSLKFAMTRKDVKEVGLYLAFTVHICCFCLPSIQPLILDIVP